jgi:hypothetical protein
MRFRPLGLMVSACLCGALFGGCADGGSSATRAGGALPAGGQSAAVQPPAGAVRRTQSVPTCSGTSGFIAEGGGSNVSDAAYSAIVYGYGNEICDAVSSIVGGYTNIISSGGDTAQDSFIGGGYTNTITGGAQYGFIGGGHSNTLTGLTGAMSGGYNNTDAGTDGMLGAGESNDITSAGFDAVIGGGSTNKVSAMYGVIAGGTNNKVSGEGGYIAAGGYNTVSGEGAVADGGFENTAGGNFATIPGGYGNSAAGIYSFAAGVHASAVQNGTFVWSDGSNGDAILSSTRAYQFLARAAGGFTLWSNAAATVGATLAPGSGTWASASDRNMKTNIAGIDDAAVLDKVAALPISRWSYKSEHGVRHVGPMAQDFYAAFKVGEDDKHITSIDEDGVALAAIKALHVENGALRTQEAASRAAIATLHAENVQLRRQFAAVKAAQSAHDRRVDAALALLGVRSLH